MRAIVTHSIFPNDRQPALLAKGNVGPGGAEQRYTILYQNKEVDYTEQVDIDFISLEKNGVTNEVLLAILIDRLEGFQSGPYACNENARALTACREALGALQDRTRDRLIRGVENTDKP